MGIEPIVMETLIAFATSEEFPRLTEDDLLAAKALQKRGIQVDPMIWTGPNANWSKFSAVVIRSCWDYHLKPNDFLSWLSELDRKNVVVWNSYETVRWNMNKTYLNDLQKRGVPVLDSVWLTDAANQDLRSLMLEKGWNQAVVKPMISAAAKNTANIQLRNAQDYQLEFETLLKRGGVIVQDFAEEIQTEGEWSFIFFDKVYSHSVIKKPQNGDFRVQSDFGGKARAAVAPAYLVKQAQEIVDSISEDLLYTRVDGVNRNGVLTLMELELIEPLLFFEMDTNAPDRFASVLAQFLSNKAGMQ